MEFETYDPDANSDVVEPLISGNAPIRIKLLTDEFIFPAHLYDVKFDNAGWVDVYAKDRMIPKYKFSTANVLVVYRALESQFK